MKDFACFNAITSIMAGFLMSSCFSQFTQTVLVPETRYSYWTKPESLMENTTAIKFPSELSILTNSSWKYVLRSSKVVRVLLIRDDVCNLRFLISFAGPIIYRWPSVENASMGFVIFSILNVVFDITRYINRIIVMFCFMSSEQQKIT